MFTGRKYRLSNPTLALELVDGKRTAVTVPADAVIEILSGPIHRTEDALVKILWQGKTLNMFALDVEIRGTLLPEQSATA